MVLTLDDLTAAYTLVGPHVHRTPVVSSRTIGERVEATVILKCENLQRTGSFKPRGALHHLLRLDPARRSAGVVTVSAGNHAQALAWAAARAGVTATVVMPHTASPAKIEASRTYGATIELVDTVYDAFARARALEASRGLAFVHPFDDRDIIAGAAGVGLEILDQVSDVTTVVVPVGGGGHLSGIIAALTARGSAARVYGVEPTGADAMSRSLDAGHPIHLDRIDTLADGLAPPMAGELPFAIIQPRVEAIVTVSDDELLAAMGLILSRAKLLVEPSGAAAVAALLAGRIPLRSSDRVVAVLSGGNIDPTALRTLLP